MDSPHRRRGQGLGRKSVPTRSAGARRGGSDSRGRNPARVPAPRGALDRQGQGGPVEHLALPTPTHVSPRFPTGADIEGPGDTFRGVGRRRPMPAQGAHLRARGVSALNENADSPTKTPQKRAKGEETGERAFRRGLPATASYPIAPKAPGAPSGHTPRVSPRGCHIFIFRTRITVPVECGESALRGSISAEEADLPLTPVNSPHFP